MNFPFQFSVQYFPFLSSAFAAFSIALGQASPGRPLPLVLKWRVLSRTTGSQLGHGRRKGWVPGDGGDDDEFDGDDDDDDHDDDDEDEDEDDDDDIIHHKIHL